MRVYVAASDCRIAPFSPGYVVAVVCSRSCNCSAGDSWCGSSFGFDVCECLPGGVPRLFSGHSLPTRDCRLDIEWINFNAVTVPAGALGGKKGRAAAAKGIENDVVALRRIQNGVGNHRDRLNRGMEIKSAFLTFTRKAVGAGVIPDVGAIASEAAELDVVAMLLLAVAEHEDEFMP